MACAGVHTQVAQRQSQPKGLLPDLFVQPIFVHQVWPLVQSGPWPCKAGPWLSFIGQSLEIVLWPCMLPHVTIGNRLLARQWTKRIVETLAIVWWPDIGHCTWPHCGHSMQARNSPFCFRRALALQSWRFTFACLMVCRCYTNDKPNDINFGYLFGHGGSCIFFLSAFSAPT